DDPDKKERARQAFDLANDLHEVWQTKLTALKKQYEADPNYQGKGIDIELVASNRLQEEALLEMQGIVRQRDALLQKIKDEGRSPSEAEKQKLDHLNVLNRQMLGKALLFANEAYLSAGPVRHIVGNIQTKMGMELTKQDKLSSFNEQWGDALKDLHHYKDD